jgi:hypothetical protein
MPYSHPPGVVVSRDGATAIQLVVYEGIKKVPNRSASAVYFTARLLPKATETRLAVLFARPIGFQPSAYGIPDYGDTQANIAYVAEARIGEFLDRGAPIRFTPSGTTAFEIECFSAQFEEWKHREAADDSTVQQYIEGGLYWAWKYGYEGATFSSADCLRLRCDLSDIRRIAKLGENVRWETRRITPNAVTLFPLQPLLVDRAKSTTPSSTTAQPAVGREEMFVDPQRIESLRAIVSPRFDLTRVIRICEELNVAYVNECYLAVALLTRALIDHVPPIFAVGAFSGVANNYGGSRSFRESMNHLDNSARKIADAHLHVQIQAREVLPNRTQVNFSRDLDVLLAELVRVL